MVIFNFWTAPHLHVCIRHLSQMTTNHQQNTQQNLKGHFVETLTLSFPWKQSSFSTTMYNNNNAKQQLDRKISGAQQPVFLKTVRPCWMYQMSCCFSPHPSGSCAALKFLFLSINFAERWCFTLSFLSFSLLSSKRLYWRASFNKNIKIESKYNLSLCGEMCVSLGQWGMYFSKENCKVLRVQ